MTTSNKRNQISRKMAFFSACWNVSQCFSWSVWLRCLTRLSYYTVRQGCLATSRLAITQTLDDMKQPSVLLGQNFATRKVYLTGECLSHERSRCPWQCHRETTKRCQKEKWISDAPLNHFAYWSLLRPAQPNVFAMLSHFSKCPNAELFGRCSFAICFCVSKSHFYWLCCLRAGSALRWTLVHLGGLDGRSNHLRSLIYITMKNFYHFEGVQFECKRTLVP